MRFIRCSAGAVVVAAGLLPLTACTTAPQVAPIVTVAPVPPTATVTPTPVARMLDSPLDSFEAWTVCVSYVDHFEASGAPRTNTQHYAPDLVTESNGVFTVA